MTARRTLPASLMLAALGCLAAPPLAAHVIEVHTTPAVTAYPAPPAAHYDPVTRTYYYDEPRVVEYRYAPPITVTAPRATEDEIITRDVMDVLARDPRLTGRIAVETFDNEVTLSGVVSTPGKARIAARDAQSVAGVRHVVNDLRPRVGGMP